MNKLIRREQLFHLISAHFKEIIREPEVLFWGIIFPILMSLGLGIAFTKKADIVRHVVLIDSGRIGMAEPRQPSGLDLFLQQETEKITPARDEPLRYKITITNEHLGNTTFVFWKTGWENAMTLMKRGSLSVVITETDNRIQYHFDPSNPDAQLTYLKLSQILGSEESTRREAADSVEALTVRGTRYIDFLVPGLVAMGIMMSCIWGISYGMIEKRSQKLLRRMVATPMKKSHLLMSLMIVRMAMNLIESALLLIFAHLVFDITIQGNPAALLAIFLAGNIAFAGIAIFVSSHTEKTETGNGLINVVVTPMVVLSGIFFSYRNFPDWSLPFIQNLPLTLLADGLRSIFIEGAGFAEISVPAATLAAIGIFFFSIGLKIFKWH
ncbi:MAG: ABC transporter permease [Desulfobacterales bacterium]|nr:ABC transporter permease [Desulfobacterales bacterium]